MLFVCLYVQERLAVGWEFGTKPCDIFSAPERSDMPLFSMAQSTMRTDWKEVGVGW